MSEHILRYENRIKTVIDQILNSIYPEGAFGIVYKEIEFDQNDVSEGIVREGIDRLKDNCFIWTNTLMLGNNRISTSLTDLGILEIEQYRFDEDKLGREIVLFLEIIASSTESELRTPELITRMRNRGSNLTDDQIENFICFSIEYTCETSKFLGRNISVYNGVKSITEFGKDVLEKFNERRNLFKTLDEDQKTFILKEHRIIEIFASSELWKECCIKMGAIIEFLLEDWGIKNRSKFKTLNSTFNFEKADFEMKLNALIKELKINDLGIGTPADWIIVKDVIKDYRNNVHLQKYFKSHFKLKKEDFLRIYPIYEDLIKLF